MDPIQQIDAQKFRLDTQSDDPRFATVCAWCRESFEQSSWHYDWVELGEFDEWTTARWTFVEPGDAALFKLRWVVSI